MHEFTLTDPDGIRLLEELQELQGATTPWWPSYDAWSTTSDDGLDQLELRGRPGGRGKGRADHRAGSPEREPGVPLTAESLPRALGGHRKAHHDATTRATGPSCGGLAEAGHDALVAELRRLADESG